MFSGAFFYFGYLSSARRRRMYRRISVIRVEREPIGILNAAAVLA